ncbi:MAG: TonB-dependent receptor, partial [Massilia sp.]
QSARNKKRDSESMSDSIVADDIGKLPDQNIAEAAQRIPGVQMSRYKGEGRGIAIRGLGDTKIVLNGQEVYGPTGNGRNFDLEDLPADVLAGVDVYKSSSANEIEGGMGGYVDIRTRKPFDFSTPQAVLVAKATSFVGAPGFGAKVKPQVSALLSNRWMTGVGEMGLLFNVAHGESRYGLGEDEVQNTTAVSNFAGSGKTVTMPSGIFTGNGHNGTRLRDTGILAYQWRPSSNLTLDANVTAINYVMNNEFRTARLYPGDPTSTYTLWGDTNTDGSDNLKSGTFSNNRMVDNSVTADEVRRTRMFDVGGRWSDGGDLTVKGRISHGNSSSMANLYEWGLSASIPSMSLVMNQGEPSRVSIAGVDLTNLSNIHPSYLLSIEFKNKQSNTAATLEANYKVNKGILSSLDVGLRANDYTHESIGFVNFYCIDGCNSSKTLASVDPSLLTTVPATESREIGAYRTFSAAAVRQQSALRGLYGITTSEPYTPDQFQLNKEKSAAGYIKLNYELALAGMPLTGNLGVRYINTKFHAEAYGADKAGTLVLQSNDSSRTDVLPSLNAHLALRDDLVLRAAASKTFAPVAFGFLKGAVTITNQAQHEAASGNPNLKPLESSNLDASLEQYFGRTGMAYVSLFKKTVDGYAQQINQNRIINGEEYKVTSFETAGTSRIKGLEAGYQQFFDRLPAPFDGLGAQVNYTYVESDAATSAPIAGKTIPLQGLSKNSYNLVAMYEKGKIKARLAYNYRSSFVAAAGSGASLGVPIYEAGVGVLDCSLSYDISKKMSVVVDGVNIAGAHSEQYFGTPHTQRNYLPIGQRYGVQIRYAL